MRTIWLIGASLGAVASAQAQQAADADRHDAMSADIVVTAPFSRDRADLLSGVSVLQGEALTREITGCRTG